MKVKRRVHTPNLRGREGQRTSTAILGRIVTREGSPTSHHQMMMPCSSHLRARIPRAFTPRTARRPTQPLLQLLDFLDPRLGLALELLDVFDRALHGGGLAVALRAGLGRGGGSFAAAGPALGATVSGGGGGSGSGTSAAAFVFAGGMIFRSDVVGARRRRWRQQRLHFLERGVDAVATALLGDFVGGALGGEIGGELLWVVDAGEAGTVDEVLVVRFRGEEESVVLVGHIN